MTILELHEWNSDSRDSKIIKNETKLEPISWELNVKNRFLNLCMGVLIHSIIESMNKLIFLEMAMKRNMHEVEEMRERKKQKNRESAQRARDRFKAK